MNKSKISKWFVLILLALIYSAAALDSFGDSSHFDRARALEGEKKLDAAYDEYVKSIHEGEQPDVKPAWSAAGRALELGTRELGRFDETVQLIKEVLAKEPKGYLYSGYLNFELARFYSKRVIDHEKAREYYKKSLEHYLKDNRIVMLSRCRREMADDYMAEVASSDYYRWVNIKKPYSREAHRLLQEALALNDQVEPEWRDNERFQILDMLSDMYARPYFEGHDDDKAMAYSLEALEVTKSLDEGARDSATRNLVYKYEKRKEYAKVIELLQPFVAKGTDDVWLNGRFFHAYRGLHDYENAYAYGRKILALLNAQRNELKTDKEKIAKLPSNWNYYTEFTIDSALKIHKPDEAYDLIELATARAMLDWMGSRESKGKKEEIASQTKERETLLARADEIRAALSREKTMGQPEQTASLQRSLVLVEDQAQKLGTQLDANRRELMSTTAVVPMTSREVQDLIGTNTIIVFRQALFAAVVTKDQVTVRDIRGKSKLHGLVKKYRKAVDEQAKEARSLEIEQPGARPPAGTNSLALAQQLYDILIRPLEKDIHSDLVYVVPDRMLPLIPFQALHDGEKFWGERHTIVYAPSASVLKFCIARRKPFQGRVLAFGNPALSDPRYELVHAEEEVKAIADLFPETRVLTRADATEKAMDLLSGEADVLHFACHGTLNEDDPLRTCLRLSPDADNDGNLYAAEIFEKNVRAGLVTLSACESALGEVTQGSEVLGLPRAWMYAGAPSVLASLWKVDDRATSQLMVDFYRNLKTMNKAEALHAAQLRMIHEGYSPFYWAAFCLYGDYL